MRLEVEKQRAALAVVDSLGLIAALGGVATSCYYHNWMAAIYAAALCMMFARVLVGAHP